MILRFSLRTFARKASNLRRTFVKSHRLFANAVKHWSRTYSQTNLALTDKSSDLVASHRHLQVRLQVTTFAYYS